MKNLAVAILVAVFLVQVRSDQHQLIKLLEECVKSSGIDTKVVEDAFQNKIVKDDPKFKEYLGCFFTTAQFTNPDGTVNYEAVLKQLPFINLTTEGPEENMKEVLEGCQKKNLHSSTITETAFLNFKCFKGLL